MEDQSDQLQPAKNNEMISHENPDLHQLPQPLTKQDIEETIFSVLKNQEFQSFRSAPIPSAEDAEKYEKLSPGAANRFISIIERPIAILEGQSTHRQKMESETIRGGNKRADWGLIMGFVLALIILWGVYKAVMAGHDWAATTIFGIFFVGGVTSFISTSKRRENEREDREKLLISENEQNQQNQDQ